MQELVCYCFQIEEEKVRDLIRSDEIQDFQELIAKSGAGMGCQGCHFRLKRILQDERTCLMPDGGQTILRNRFGRRHRDFDTLL